MLKYSEIINKNINDLTEIELVESIKFYNQQYRNGDSQIEDIEYDNLVEILYSINPNSDFFNISIIDNNENSSRKEELPIQMFSLDKEKNVDDIINWIKSNSVNSDELVIITPKFDGISLAINESNNHAWTRGNGYIGQRSDDHYKLCNGYNKNNNYFYTFGEVIISKENWKNNFENKINIKSGKLYKSSRNTVTGLFNNDEPNPELKYVDYIRYGLVDNNNSLNKNEQLELLNSLNIVKLKYEICYVSDLVSLHNNNKLDFYLNELYKDWSKDYQIDGLVIEFNRYILRENLGREKNNNPKFARAIKLPNWFDIYQTKIIDIIFKVSKQGKVKPVFIIEPVNINGATINKATAYNCKYLIDNNIAIGSIIDIVRSGDVIPKHIKTISYIDNGVFDLKNKLKKCPSCGNSLIWDETETELICTNPNCKDIQLSKLIHFVTTLKFEEFGEKEIENLFNQGFDSYSKLLYITYSDLINLNGWADKSIQNLLNQIKRLNEFEIDFALLLHALDLFDGKLGYKTCKLILNNININNLDDINIYELTKIKGVSDITAHSFINGIKQFYNSKYNELPIKYNINKRPNIIIGDLCSNFKVCFTGVRNINVEKFIIENGGTIIDNVSKNTTHLIIKDYSNKTLSSGKAKKAQDISTIVIISLDDFKNKFGL